VLKLESGRFYHYYSTPLSQNPHSLSLSISSSYRMEPSIAHHTTPEEGGPSAMEEDDHGCLSAFIDTGSVESHRLYLARRTALEMLRDRGYGVAVTDLEQSLAAFRSLYGENPDLERLKISSVLLRDPSKMVPSFLLPLVSPLLLLVKKAMLLEIDPILK